MLKKSFLLLTLVISFSAFGFGLNDGASCAKSIYAKGMLRNYDMLGQSWGATTGKGGFKAPFMTSTESTTSQFDPGVTTGRVMSSSGFTSSFGECSGLKVLLVNKEMRDDYIDIHLVEVKKQIAQGHGHHLVPIAFGSGCDNFMLETWTKALRTNMETLYDVKSGKEFGSKLDELISKDDSLSNICNLEA